MKKKVFLIVKIFLLTTIISGNEDNEESNEVPESIEVLLTKKILLEANTLKNVIIAPKEIQNFLTRKPSVEDSAEYDEWKQDDIDKDPIRITTKLATKQMLRKYENETFQGNEKFLVRNCIHEVTINTKWKFNFQKRDTHKRVFYNTPDHHTYSDTMRKDDIFRIGEIDSLNATALELPLFTSGYFLVLILPKAKNGLASLARDLSQNLEMLEEIPKQHLHSTLVRVFLPTIHIASKIKMDDLTEKFQIKYEDFDSLTHYAHILVNEHGFGLSERTTVLFWNAFSSFRTTPELFNINHPFLFYIRNNEGAQFIGYLSDLT